MYNYIKMAAEMIFALGSEYGNYAPKNGKKLIFPLQKQPQKDEVKRISEQELRQCFIDALNKSQHEYFYSVETPTVHKYRKTGSKDISGNLDLCLYTFENGIIERKVCIEFKAHNMDSSYSFDLYKTTRESGNNLYYHLLGSMNNGTLTASTNKRKGILVKLQQDLMSLDTHKIHSESLTIAVVCLSPCLMMYQNITKDALIQKNFNIQDFEYRVERKTLKIFDSKNWSVVIQ